MAYRKTEKVLAQLAEKRDRIMTAAHRLSAATGIEAVSCEAVAAKAGVSVGLVFHYFPDMEELRTAVAQQLLDGDLIAIREHIEDEDDPLMTLVSAMMVFFTRFASARLADGMNRNGTYDSGIRLEFSRLIGAATDMPAVDAKMAARAAMGVVYGMVEAHHGQRDNRASAMVLFVLRGIGVSEARARKILARCWGADAAVDTL